MDDPDLPDTLRRLLQSGTDSNPALESLMDDYTRHHLALAVLGGAFVLGFFLLGLRCWRRFRRPRPPGGRRWTFERKTYLAFTLSSVALGLGLAVVVAANLANALEPRQGFEGSIDMIGTPRPGTKSADLQQAFTTWLESGASQRPALVQSSIDGRLAWQRPKAIICSVLLVGFVALSRRIWRTLIRRSRVRRGTGTDRALLGIGVGTGMVCLLLMAMVLGNAQASLAPLSMTLIFG